MATEQETMERLDRMEILIAEMQGLSGQHGHLHGIEGSDPIGGATQVKDTPGTPTHTAPAGTRCHVVPDLESYVNTDGASSWKLFESGGTGAPGAADYLLGTINAGLANGIVVGTAPQGELGGSWASPTVDSTHAGGTHHDETHASRHAGAGADDVGGLDMTITGNWDVTGITGRVGMQSGAGAPSHTEVQDTPYWDTTNKVMYVNNLGTDTWTGINIFEYRIGFGVGRDTFTH